MPISRLWSSRLFLTFALFAAVSACGGGESRPGPLKYHLDDMYIAQVPMEEKQGVLQAQNEFSAARMQRATAEASFNEATTELEVAKNERSQAGLDEKSAQTRKKAADDSADMNRVNTATRELLAAKLTREAADKKVRYLEAHRGFLRKKLLQTEDEMYAKEAQYELSKARLTQSKNIRPKGFVLANYETQAQDRARYAQRTAAKLKDAQAKVENLRREWQAKLQEAERARGGSSSVTQSSDAL